MKPTDSGAVAMADEVGENALHSIRGVHGIRYQTADVQRAADFYTTHLGFTLEHQQLPQFATVALNGLKLFLSGPGASGSRAMPDGRRQEPGGWNRIVLEVTSVARQIERLEKAGVTFRNEMETGPAGRQVQIEDPDGNPIELFEPTRR
jgi:glyoxylase I family protein